MNREEIEEEVDRIIAGNRKLGLREHLLAWQLFTFGFPVDVRCPQCKSEIVVMPFPQNNGANIKCNCGRAVGPCGDYKATTRRTIGSTGAAGRAVSETNAGSPRPG